MAALICLPVEACWPVIGKIKPILTGSCAHAALVSASDATASAALRAVDLCMGFLLRSFLDLAVRALGGSWSVVTSNIARRSWGFQTIFRRCQARSSACGGLDREG